MYRSFGDDFIDETHHTGSYFDAVCASVDLCLFVAAVIWLIIRSKTARIKTGAVKVEKVRGASETLAKRRISVIDSQVSQGSPKNLLPPGVLAE